MEQWAAEETILSDLEEIKVQQLYRAMDLLLEANKQVQKNVFFGVADVFNLEVDLICFDTTSTYFETETTDDYRKHGYSKYRRPDLPQTVIGLDVTREGLPDQG